MAQQSHPRCVAQSPFRDAASRDHFRLWHISDMARCPTRVRDAIKSGNCQTFNRTCAHQCIAGSGGGFTRRFLKSGGVALEILGPMGDPNFLRGRPSA